MSFKWKLSNYLSISVERWVITEQQKKDIQNIVETETSNIWFFKILSLIGSSCIWLWVLLIISSNWWYFPQFVQLILALFLPIIPLLIWHYFLYVQKELKTLWTCFVYLSWFLIWASISLIWQIYNTDWSAWSLFALWFVLLLPLVYIFRFKALSLLSIGLFYIAFYYSITGDWSLFSSRETVLMLYFVIPGLISIWSYFLNKFSKGDYHYFLFPFFAISLKIALIASFIATVEKSFYFIEIPFLQNLLFIGITLLVIWWSNKNSEILIKHSALFWMWAYMITKYFVIFWSYLSGWIFFISSWCFLIGIVYLLMKVNKYLENKKL